MSSIFNVPTFPNPSFNAINQITPDIHLFNDEWIRYFEKIFQKVYFPTLEINSPSGSPINVSEDNIFYLIDTSSSAVTANLPSAEGLEGRYKIFKNIAGSANNLTIDANGSETIDGALTLILASNASTTIISDGSNWHTI